MVYGRSGPDKEIEIGKMGGQSILRKTAVSRKTLVSIVFIDDFKAHPTLVSHQQRRSSVLSMLAQMMGFCYFMAK